MDIRFHTDGKINDILEDLIELGVDIINIHQPNLVGVDEISKIGQGRICFEASVDIPDHTADRRIRSASTVKRRNWLKNGVPDRAALSA